MLVGVPGLSDGENKAGEASFLGEDADVRLLEKLD